MRLLYLVREKFPTFRPDVTELFGVELPIRGMRVVAVMRSEKRADRTVIRRMGGAIAVVTPASESDGIVGKIKNMFWLTYRYLVFVRLGWRKQWDVIQSRDEVPGPWLVRMAALRQRAARTFWLSFPFPEEKLEAAERSKGMKRPLLKLRGLLGQFFLYRTGLRLVDHVFVQSEQMRTDVARFGVPLDRMSSVPMAVQLRGREDILVPVREKPKKLTIGYLGTLDAARRMDFMVRVLKIVREAIPDAELLLVGEGARPSDRHIIEAEGVRCGVRDAITITGFLPRDEAWRKLESAFVCVSPFYPTFILNSTSPTKLVEYMQLGMPVLANDHPEQRRVIQESGAGRCVAWDERAFADAICDMWANSTETLAAAQNGPHYVRACRSYESIGLAVFDQYSRLAGGTS
ncbi:glycosyltransferase [Niveibacterium sp.]|uniref:glycosyltransferase n=1 Tax=Niveibacterium sp. TaxID=2017444 RepID=UPI0035B27B2D